MHCLSLPKLTYNHARLGQGLGYENKVAMKLWADSFRNGPKIKLPLFAREPSSAAGLRARRAMTLGPAKASSCTHMRRKTHTRARAHARTHARTHPHRHARAHSRTHTHAQTDGRARALTNLANATTAHLRKREQASMNTNSNAAHSQHARPPTQQSPRMARASITRTST